MNLFKDEILDLDYIYICIYLKTKLWTILQFGWAVNPNIALTDNSVLVLSSLIVVTKRNPHCLQGLKAGGPTTVSRSPT